MAQRVRVAAGILRDSENNILITERLGDSAFPGLWEFPGGKCRAGESTKKALFRELKEELGIEACAAEPLITLDHDYPDRQVSIEFFLVDSWRGRPDSMLGQQLRWCRPDELSAAELLPADAPVLVALAERQ